MKKSVLVSTLSFLALLIISCSKDDTQTNINENSYLYSLRALSHGSPVPGTKIIAITNKADEIIGECDANGDALIQTSSPVITICCVSLGKSGIINTNREGNFIVEMGDLKNLEIKNTKSIGTFGVYSTDGNGDVSFKYAGAFQGYYCTSYLPNLGSPNPNNWDSWDLTNWLPTWKGKKLLVPRKYQIYHQTAYGYSISNALFLMALY